MQQPLWLYLEVINWPPGSFARFISDVSSMVMIWYIGGDRGEVKLVKLIGWVLKERQLWNNGVYSTNSHGLCRHWAVSMWGSLLLKKILHWVFGAQVDRHCIQGPVVHTVARRTLSSCRIIRLEVEAQPDSWSQALRLLIAAQTLLHVTR